jgi:hypothetical protein
MRFTAFDFIAHSGRVGILQVTVKLPFPEVNRQLCTDKPGLSEQQGFLGGAPIIGYCED